MSGRIKCNPEDSPWVARSKKHQKMDILSQVNIFQVANWKPGKPPQPAKKRLRAKATMKSGLKTKTPQRKRGHTLDASAGTRHDAPPGGGVKRKRPSRSTRPPSNPAPSSAQRPETTINSSIRGNADIEHRGYAALFSRATTGISSCAPSFVHPANYQPPPSHGAVLGWSYPRLPQSQDATLAPTESQVSARHHDDTAYHHRDAARGLSNGPLQNPRITKENDLNHSARAVALGGDTYPRNAAADDVLSMYDPQEHDTEQRGYDVRPCPPQDLHLGATLWDMGDRRQHISFSEATRFCTRAPPPVLVREDQTPLTSTHATSRPSEQHTVYARVKHDAASYGTLSLPTATATLYQTYNDIMRPDAAPHYIGSPSSSSGSSITAVEDPYELGALVNMHAPTVPEPIPIQLSAHQHQAVSVPSALLPQNTNQFASTQAELDTSPANVLNLATAYGQPFSDNMREAFSQQGWWMPNRDTGLLAPEQPAGNSSSGADLYYAQGARVPHPTALHTQSYDPRFLGYPSSRLVSDVHTERRREHAFAVGGFSHHDARAYGQLSYNTATHRQGQHWLARPFYGEHELLISIRHLLTQCRTHCKSTTKGLYYIPEASPATVQPRHGRPTVLLPRARSTSGAT
ncbi:uncharacterized protein TRAVEDRAFT_47626 [Trametes versicolor FP-101664 SS1]|uniref:uncharacterized protein n=1 Tax=Trametes versicolor (strain FP-101664) TaxID=717944 RepID=UPI0004621D59|nr:uncharacterized protein TRAVEDRAFT_47626 [Trametes versicolor FP-101664 SS1]EIW58476.1 hypothetical protein TRAVEDRAFT_47626 [Trametes versicolor FP-101664 SS1]